MPARMKDPNSTYDRAHRAFEVMRIASAESMEHLERIGTASSMIQLRTEARLSRSARDRWRLALEEWRSAIEEYNLLIVREIEGTPAGSFRVPPTLKKDSGS